MNNVLSPVVPYVSFASRFYCDHQAILWPYTPPDRRPLHNCGLDLVQSIKTDSARALGRHYIDTGQCTPLDLVIQCMHLMTLRGLSNLNVSLVNVSQMSLGLENCNNTTSTRCLEIFAKPIVLSLKFRGAVD